MTAAAVSAWTLHSWDAAAALKLYHPSPFAELFILPNYCYLHTFILGQNSNSPIFAWNKLDIYTDEVKASPADFPFNFYKLCIRGHLLF